MTFAADPFSARDLDWYFEEARGAIERLRSTWADTILVNQSQRAMVRIGDRYVDAAPLRCGPIYVSKKRHAHVASYQMDHRALRDVGRERRIREALTIADWMVRGDGKWTCPEPPSVVLWLLFGSALTPSRAMFTPGSDDRLRRTLAMAASKNKVTRERVHLSAISARAQTERGRGNLAHLTPAAITAWRNSRTTLLCPSWVDRLGTHLAQPVAEAEERELGRAIAQQCELLELQALARYRAAIVRVPERVRRAAAARDDDAPGGSDEGLISVAQALAAVAIRRDAAPPQNRVARPGPAAQR